MFETDLNDSFLRVCGGWLRERVAALALAGVDASWLDPSAKSALRRDFEAEIAMLIKPAESP